MEKPVQGTNTEDLMTWAEMNSGIHRRELYKSHIAETLDASARTKVWQTPIGEDAAS